MARVIGSGNGARTARPIKACLFDLDGVLTQTAKVHAAAWKQMFDEFLRKRDGDDFKPFDAHDDYDEYVDGKPRADGIRSFLESRGIELVRWTEIAGARQPQERARPEADRRAGRRRL